MRLIDDNKIKTPNAEACPVALRLIDQPHHHWVGAHVYTISFVLLGHRVHRTRLRKIRFKCLIHERHAIDQEERLFNPARQLQEVGQHDCRAGLVCVSAAITRNTLRFCFLSSSPMLTMARCA